MENSANDRKYQIEQERKRLDKLLVTRKNYWSGFKDEFKNYFDESSFRISSVDKDMISVEKNDFVIRLSIDKSYLYDLQNENRFQALLDYNGHPIGILGTQIGDEEEILRYSFVMTNTEITRKFDKINEILDFLSQ